MKTENQTNIDQIQREIISEFEGLEDLEKYEYLIELAKILPKMPEEYKTPENKVTNCQSRTWLVLDKTNSQNNSQTNSPIFSFFGFSDSQLVSGLIALLWRVYHGQDYETARQTKLFFLEEIGLNQLLTVGRREGFWQIQKKLKEMAEFQQNS